MLMQRENASEIVQGWECQRRLTRSAAARITLGEIRELSLLLISNPTSSQLPLFKALWTAWSSQYLTRARINSLGSVEQPPRGFLLAFPLQLLPTPLNLIWDAVMALILERTGLATFARGAIAACWGEVQTWGWRRKT